MSTCLDSSRNFCYMFLNLVGELGEFSSKIAKAVRHESMYISYNGLRMLYPSGWGFFSDPVNMELKEELKKEAGDILWQLSGLCEVLGWSLEDVARRNLEKLASRKQRGVIDGSGDNR